MVDRRQRCINDQLKFLLGGSYERKSKRGSFNMLVELAVFTEEQLLGLQRDRLTHLKWSYCQSVYHLQDQMVGSPEV